MGFSATKLRDAETTGLEFLPILRHWSLWLQC